VGESTLDVNISLVSEIRGVEDKPELAGQSKVSDEV
jgi:hypothetical protein